MKNIIRSLLVLTGVFCGAFMLTAQDRATQFDNIFTQLHRDNKFSGNVLIAENGKPIFQKSYGFAFREKNELLNSESIFEICSIGKQFTAMLIMMLEKQGKLSYSDSLRKFLPDLPYHNITIRHMLNHTSGLPDYVDLAEKHWDSTKILMNEDAIALLAEKKPQVEFSPGTQWQYSNTGYLLLCKIIEKVSGQNFITQVKEKIFLPLEMSHTEVYRKRYEKRTIPNYAYGYVKDEKTDTYIMADSSQVDKAFVYFMDGIYGDGVTSSTAPDMLKWEQALYTEKLVSREMIEEAFSPAELNDGTTFGYGFGWMIKNTKEFGKILMHSGGWPGYKMWIERHPDTNKTIIIFANAGDAFEKLGSVRYLLYNMEEPPQKEIQLTRTQKKSLTGSYQFGTQMIHVSLTKNKLYIQSTRQAKKINLSANVDGSFFTKFKGEKIWFQKNNKNETTHLLIDSNTYPDRLFKKKE
ncbi:serine hydrolase domain-containing protein [Kaistella faecalis]|uniref:serine hydrolase domain-containing protein n=1 Tax=Kaistella faecalis TaxID=2852098 RepID=UPI001C462568|nr:serine hydrolase domain-containing protein [Chryseobacterium faecale]UFK97967.1 beta-lactamase family protein [Chryseobacterium faecale]